MRFRSLLIAVLTVAAATPFEAQRPQRQPVRPQPAPVIEFFEVHERSIVELQEAMRAGRVTSRGLVESYLARIQAYDQAGPRLNAIVLINPRARDEAEAMDRERAGSKVRGPLHGIPVLIKDNYDTSDMPTSGGALGLAGLQPAADAFQVRKLRDAGAVILGKTTMHELAAGITNISSYTAQTRNPYGLDRVPGGSSGGTGAAVGASFAAAGMGSDTCGSIRIPAANQNLVGLRGTHGLSSRSGVMPLSSTQDIAGPLARTVTDLAIMLDATVGPDPNDPITADGASRIPRSYRDALRPNALKGARIGTLRALWGTAPEDEEVAGIVRKALDGFKAQGAEIIEVAVPGLDELLRESSVIGDEFKFDLAAYLAKHPQAPVKSLGEILERGLYHAELETTFRLRNAPEKRDNEHYRQALIKRRAARAAVLATLEEHRVDALAYPTLRRKPALIGEPQAGTNCQLSATTGLPAISIPAGFSTDGLPIGLELLAGAWEESKLLNYALAWEQASKLRRPPFSTPPLVKGMAPSPIERVIAVGAATVKLTYDGTTGALQYQIATTLPTTDRIIGITLQRSEGDKPGAIVAHLMAPNQGSGAGTATLRGRNREDLAAGRLYLHLYTRQSPLGIERQRVTVERRN
ncbi:MAG TPA: amidase family protein [Vicinamibacterales bacterium]|nr:amidase family protein [Vicinamibacterales bacterium]